MNLFSQLNVQFQINTRRQINAGTRNKFWGHLCEIGPCRPSIYLNHYDNQSIAKILNVHFSTIGTKLAMKLKSFITLPSFPARSTDLPKFVFKPITEEFVRGQLKQLRTNKAIGLDNISARLLKDSASAISKSLTKLFN